MLDLSSVDTIRGILRRHGFTFSKSLGQNFIVDPTICPRIAELGGAAPGFGVIEIGAGIGVLTCELAARAQKVVCIELDSRLLPILGETLADYSNIKVINQDVLKVDLQRLITEEFAGLEVVVCANLPYYITSPILMGLLEARLPVRFITVMVQKEAAQRICAREGTRGVGAISFAVRHFSEPEVLFDVPRTCFLPSPEVDSCVIRLTLREHPAIPPAEEAFFFRVVRGAFCQRRKTACNSLCAALSLAKPDVAAALAQVGIAATARPEELTLAQFRALATALAAYTHG